MIGTLVMLVGGYMGEAGYINLWAGFIVAKYYQTAQT